jgi:effector-binding domain-containing protein
MVDIQENKELKLQNLISMRKKMPQTEIEKAMISIGAFMKDNNLSKNGPVITTTYAVEMENNIPHIDMEILIPIKEDKLPDDSYNFKKEFHLTNAVYARHTGNPAMLQNTYQEMMNHIKENNKQQITTGYNVNIKEIKPGESMDEMIMDVYIGINPNKL